MPTQIGKILYADLAVLATCMRTRAGNATEYLAKMASPTVVLSSNREHVSSHQIEKQFNLNIAVIESQFQVDGEIGKAQLEGEFTGMSELYNLMPTLVPKPYAWGALKGVSSPVYFLLVEFKHFRSGRLPDPVKLGSRLAALHRKSVSSTGKFGFHMTTYDGARTQAVEWDSSWTSFFSKLLAEAYRHDVETNGHWEELDRVFTRTQSHYLIPRPVGVLESGGRSIKPCLIHRDLWEGNIGTDAETGDPWIFDAAAYYAHHEMELGIWRAERHELRAEIYREEYFRHMLPSEPVEECDDRNRLYSVKTNLMHSACVRGSPARQQRARDVYSSDLFCSVPSPYGTVLTTYLNYPAPAWKSDAANRLTD
ncbi:hypothetical protein T310_2203 [Rasamsonia emersonii CBS 393.64]|uniref:protein-ribulosamine 3-kinase n=1 Tax=Rasamsonia emersonii (strain ATCC 16479 / CBS 393.64 / IMI 116815) TaxID=1408163 RepID=A0A0F4Z0Y6_RASE3|nr:hypothetical protein T310_2203 [Rasamsonia emersonii CBS 393.64]KKA23751.1 hypothetical protein T310_2203 [Rasamsonia emersonii CBS 393.64]